MDSLTLSICVATRNRPDDLVRCLNSLVLLDQVEFEIIVIDDASDVPIVDRVLQDIDPALAPKLQIFRHEKNKGTTATRNELAERANAPYLLYLDDDAQLLDAESIYAAIEVFQASKEVGAVALSQADKAGALLPGQPSSTDYRCYTPSFIGYGTLLRREVFVELGGYRELFAIFYEEPEFCKRMLDRGFSVVYLPDARVIHFHSPIGRNNLIALRNGCRNKCFAAIYNEPLAMMIFSIPLRILIYAYTHQAYCRQHKIESEFGADWIVREIRQNLPALWHDRRALKWSTYYKWHKTKQAPAYSMITDP
ncbi:MAG TPA: glycosyltransferase [Leptolyngbya sp.]|jgi:GT2 family glycosyltransferase|nr:glycosyltransferase [Leptolyngbya sp.]